MHVTAIICSLDQKMQDAIHLISGRRTYVADNNSYYRQVTRMWKNRDKVILEKHVIIQFYKLQLNSKSYTRLIPDLILLAGTL